MIIISFLVKYFQMTFTAIFNVLHTSSAAQMIIFTVNMNHNKAAVYFFFLNAPVVVWMKTKLLLLLLFTFPATYSYLLLITLPPSVVTKTQSNPWSSAWHHIDRRTLTHFVGELADSIYFPFFLGKTLRRGQLSWL